MLAIGEGRASRIYRTTDGGKTWEKTFQNTSPQAFFNCIDFYAGGRKGLGVSDPVKGKFRIIETRDRGRTWTVAKRRGMPAAVDGEFNFAASGTCLTVSGRHAYMASGGAASRIFHSRNFGRTWTVTDAPIPATDAGGVFSLSFKRATRGVAVGGDFLAPDNGVDASGFTRRPTLLEGGRRPRRLPVRQQLGRRQRPRVRRGRTHRHRRHHQRWPHLDDGQRRRLPRGRLRAVAGAGPPAPRAASGGSPPSSPWGSAWPGVAEVSPSMVGACPSAR